MDYSLQKQIIKTYYNDYKFFFLKPNVVGVGYGFKFINGINTYEPSIHVFVEKKVATNCLPIDGLIPISYKGIKTDVIHTGRFMTTNQCNCTSNLNTQPYYTGRIRPIQPGWGMSVSYPNQTGTFGYIVTDNEQRSQTYCLLSTNNTFSNYGRYPIDGPIIQPANAFGGKAPNDVVAKLLKYWPLTFKKSSAPPPPLSEMNTIDASVASYFNVSEVQLINPTIPGMSGVVTGITSPDIDKDVQWTGCYTGHQTGKITSISAIVSVPYGISNVGWFKNVILTTGQTTFSDEGALVCDMHKKAIGLLFSFSSNYGNLVCNIRSIQELLKVTLLTFNP